MRDERTWSEEKVFADFDMPKCTICGKRFDTITALREHHRAIHPKARFVAPKTKLSRNLVIGLILVIVIIGSLVGYLIYLQSKQTSSNQNTGLLGTAISPALYQNLTTVSDSTLGSIGTGQSGVKPPTATSSSSVTLKNNGMPEVLYIGDEWCPNCAVERWSLVIALSRFGNFSGLEYMQSAADDGNIATLTFYNSTYLSSYISFVSVENQARNGTTIQTPTLNEQSLWSTYTNSEVPFVDFGGEYVLSGAQASYSILSGMNWTQIGTQLNNPNSQVAKDLDGAANQVIATICKIDGGSPSSVCSQSFAQNISYTGQSNSSSALLNALYQVIDVQREFGKNFKSSTLSFSL